MNKLLEKVKGLLEKFKAQNKKIKIAVVVAALTLVIAIASAIVYKSTNKYEVLFSNLASTDAQTVSKYLSDNKVDTKVDSTTNTIWVPKEKVDQLRLDLAPTLTSGSTGYELMDSGSSFGMTDEEFSIKKLRMQQGELEKTIKSFPQVEEARVHITNAKESVFASDSEPGKASVYLKIKDGSSLEKDQVKAIVSLVSGATQNIPQENISVVDQNINLLTKDMNESEEDGSVNSEKLATQYDAEKSYEEKLQKAIVGLLEPVVGADKVKAKVNVNLDFDSKQKTETVIDPNKVIVSQETSKENNASGSGETSESPVDNNMSNQIASTDGNSTSTREEQKTNYDSSKSETKVISAPGERKRLTASVIVDKNLDDDTRDRLQQIVESAIGIDATKGDKITIEGIPFDTSDQDEAKLQIEAMNAEALANSRNKMYIIGGIAGAILIGLIAFFIIRRRNKKREDEDQLLDTLIDDTIIPKEPETFDPIEFENTTKKSHLENEIKKYATEKPEQVVDIIKSWLNDDER